MVFSSVYLQENLMSQVGPPKQGSKVYHTPGVLWNAGMSKFKSGILKHGITKIKHRTDKGWFTRTTQAEAQVRWLTTVMAKAI